MGPEFSFVGIGGDELFNIGGLQQKLKFYMYLGVNTTKSLRIVLIVNYARLDTQTII